MNLAELDQALADVDTWDVPLHAVAAVGPDGTLASHGATGTRVRIASVTKPIFAYAALIAVEEGVLRLDAPLGPPGATVRHLLAHASGLPFEGTLGPATPETRRIYSNAGFELVGAELAERAGMTGAEYLAAGVFEPLGMASSALEGSVARDVWSNVDDLARFAAELLRPTLVDPSTLAAATSVQFPALDGVLPEFGTQRPNPWGLGFEIRGQKTPHWTGTTNSPATFGHFGATGGFLWVDPVLDLALVCLCGRPAGPWIRDLWPPLSDRVIAATRP